MAYEGTKYHPPKPCELFDSKESCATNLVSLVVGICAREGCLTHNSQCAQKALPFYLPSKVHIFD